MSNETLSKFNFDYRLLKLIWISSRSYENKLQLVAKAEKWISLWGQKQPQKQSKQALQSKNQLEQQTKNQNKSNQLDPK